MLKRRLLVLVAMLCLLGVVTSTSVDSEGSCSCAMECRNGKAGCEYRCDSIEDMSKGVICCQQAAEATGPLQCTATTPSTPNP